MHPGLPLAHDGDSGRRMYSPYPIPWDETKLANDFLLETDKNPLDCLHQWASRTKRAFNGSCCVVCQRVVERHKREPHQASKPALKAPSTASHEARSRPEE